MSWPRNGHPTRVAEGIIQLAREINYTVMSRDEYEGRQQRTKGCTPGKHLAE